MGQGCEKAQEYYKLEARKMLENSDESELNGALFLGQQSTRCC